MDLAHGNTTIRDPGGGTGPGCGTVELIDVTSRIRTCGEARRSSVKLRAVATVRLPPALGRLQDGRRVDLAKDAADLVVRLGIDELGHEPLDPGGIGGQRHRELGA